jgi:hypothetical protein
LILVLQACVATAWPAAGNAATMTLPSSRVCGTSEPSSGEADAIQAALVEGGKPPEGSTTVGGMVQIAFHVIHDGLEGNVTDAQIEAQVAELNLNFSGAYGGHDTGYRFVLTTVDRTLNPVWFTMAQESPQERDAKRALAVDPTHHVNVYTAKIAAYGWANYPWGVEEDEKTLGIVIHYGTLPGGHLAGFNMGRTATHEMGHYFGLFHTFFTGCSQLNDYVTDTPAEAVAASGCPPDTLDTCAGPGMDPIHNFMDYTDDPCYREFTPGQDGRMDAMLSQYKPNLIVGPVAVAGAPQPEGVRFAPVSPNPASGTVAFRFALPAGERVTLKVHDLAGRSIATILDRALPPGEHRGVWESKSQSSGVYFAVLEARGERVVRRFAIVR